VEPPHEMIVDYQQKLKKTKKKKKMEKDGRVGGRKNRGEEQSEVWWLNGL